MIEIQKPTIEIKNGENDKKATFVVSPLERGFGTTLGNCMRRILLGNLPGVAAVGVKIDGVVHEFSTIKGVTEDVTDIILNLKDLAIKKTNNNWVEGNESVATLKKDTPGEVTAADIKYDAGLMEIVNKDLHICTLAEGARIDMQIYIGTGRGYVAASTHRKEKDNAFADVDASVISMDSIYTPVLDAKYFVEPLRQGADMSFEKLILEVETNGAMKPEEVVSLSATLMKQYTEVFTSVTESGMDSIITMEKKEEETVKQENDKKIDELDLPPRAFNCLKRAGINTIKELCAKTEEDLLQIKNLGKTSVQDIKVKLIESGYSLKSGDDM